MNSERAWASQQRRRQALAAARLRNMADTKQCLQVQGLTNWSFGRLNGYSSVTFTSWAKDPVWPTIRAERVAVGICLSQLRSH